MIAFNLVGPIYTISYFYFNQKEIVETFCENKDVPKSNCQGHCYLKKQLVVSNSVDGVKGQQENKVRVIWPYAFNEINEIVIPFNALNTVNKGFYINNYRFVREIKLLDPPQV